MLFGSKNAIHASPESTRLCPADFWQVMAPLAHNKRNGIPMKQRKIFITAFDKKRLDDLIEVPARAANIFETISVI